MIAENNCILLAGLPPGSLAGIDLLSFTTSPNFRGIKAVPSGLHFVFVGVHSSLSIRYGTWIQVSSSAKDTPPEMYLRKWESKDEILTGHHTDEVTHQWQQSVPSLWEKHLTPYRQNTDSPRDSSGASSIVEGSGDWQILSSHVDRVVISRITKSNDASAWNLSSTSSAARDLDQIPGLYEHASKILDPERELHFLPVDLKKTWPEGATGRTRTLAALDRTWAIDDLIAKHCTKQNQWEILGEFQFCFLMVVTLNNYSCIEQWKRLLELVLTSHEGVKTRSEFFLLFLQTLKSQLRYNKEMTEGGLIDMNDADGEFIKKLLQDAIRGLRLLDEEDSEMSLQLKEVEQSLQEQYHWGLTESWSRTGRVMLEDGEEVDIDFHADDMENETGEFSPTIVQLTEEQMQFLHFPN